MMFYFMILERGDLCVMTESIISVQMLPPSTSLLQISLTSLLSKALLSLLGTAETVTERTGR